MVSVETESDTVIVLWWVIETKHTKPRRGAQKNQSQREQFEHNQENESLVNEYENGGHKKAHAHEK